MIKSKKSSETSYKETRFGILPRSKVIQLESKGTEKGLLLLKQYSSTNKAISIQLIKKLHKECFSNILLDRAGVFRTVQVEYSGKEAPHYSKLHELMQNLCDDIEYAVKQLPSVTNDSYIFNVVELLALFQHRFVFIHPFVDYNGRISRMFTNYLLMRLGLPTIEIPAINKRLRNNYISALQKADEGDYQMLQNIIASALNESLEAIEK